MADETGSWMPMYWGDYFGDTMHLTTEEHGAYLLLLGIYWRRAKPLPDDDRWLASVTKMTTKKWKMVRPNIIEFFDISDGLLIHKRVEKEILRSSGRLQSARVAGRAGGLAKSKLTTLTKKKDPSGPKKPTIRLPDLTVKMFEEFAREKVPRVSVLLELEKFRDYCASRGRRYADYPAAFRNWLRKAQEYQDGGKGNGINRQADGGGGRATKDERGKAALLRGLEAKLPEPPH